MLDICLGTDNKTVFVCAQPPCQLPGTDIHILQEAGKALRRGIGINAYGNAVVMAEGEAVFAGTLSFYRNGQVTRHNIGAPIILQPLLHAPFTAVVYFHKVSLFLCPEEKTVHMHRVNIQLNSRKHFVGINLCITPAISESMYLRPVFRGFA